MTFRVELELAGLSKDNGRIIHSIQILGLEMESFSLSAEFESPNTVLIQLVTTDSERIVRLLDYDIQVAVTFAE